MRLFIAIAPDRAAVAGLEALVADLRQRLGDQAAAYRWTFPANAHITLHFLGDVGDAQLTRLRDALGTELPARPFQVQSGGLAIFPVSGPPRVLSLSVRDGRETLGDIYRELAARIRRAGLPIEDRPFAPHLTLARVREGERHRGVRLRDRLASLGVEEVVGWTVRHVTLFRSDLSGPAPRYDAVQELGLTPPGADGVTRGAASRVQ